ncbi:hypothetical protein PF004_g32670, partial [Phytophthora fragariae]
MQAGPVGSSRLAPLLQAASLPSEPSSAPHTIRTIRLPSLAPRLPTLPSLMSTLAAQGSATSSPTRTSSSISFLLNPPARQSVDSHHQMNQQLQQQYAPAASTVPSSIMYHPYSSVSASAPLATSLIQPQDAKPQPKKKRKTRICKSEGCEKYVVDRGLCIRHGGGKRCSVEDCNCRAQNRGLCWKHGGYTRCTVEGCTKRAKSRGIC